MPLPWRESTVREQRSIRWLRWRIVAALLFVAALPFVVVGSGAWVVFGNLAIERTLALHRNMAQAHAASIELYLSEKLRTLEMIARSYALDDLVSENRLREVFSTMAEVHESGFVDLGIIDEQGRHLAYVGPFDLMERDYSGAEWFQTVMAQGTIVSDVFLGYRQIPHSVIAVRRQSPGGWWILRATLDNRSLYTLVRSLEVGTTGDVFVVNRLGLYQTPPKVGNVLGPSSLAEPGLHPGVRDQRLVTEAGTTRQVTTWLNRNNWLLVVEQPEGEILAPVHRAVTMGAAIMGVALVLVVVAIVLVTYHLTHRVELANQERDRMYEDLLRSAKLASLGEMASGLAHEINNPLATLSAEQTNLEDELKEIEMDLDVRGFLEESIERCRRQIERCGDITAKMLQFGRQSETVLQAREVEPSLREISDLLERRARAGNALLHLDIEPHLPPVWMDATEFEQIMVNLFNNAVDAVGGEGKITISARREENHVLLQVRDDGCGIAADDLDRIFQPFFTTKPVGKGTGLGLAVVYGIVHGWGGTIEVESSEGKGTTISIRVSLATEAQRRSA